MAPKSETPDKYNSPQLNNAPGLTFGSFNGGTQNANGSTTNLDTTSNNNIYAGYSNYKFKSSASSSVITPDTLINPSFPMLDRNAGYSLNFTVRINSQVNDGTNGANRAGFSIIALSSDKQGIEIGFRNNDIFAQNNSSFNGGGESYSSASTLLLNLTNYNLNVSGNNYTLSSGSHYAFERFTT